MLDGKRALVIGVANDRSIAWGCAEAFRQNGARLALTYLNDKAEPHVRPLAEAAGADIFLPLDVEQDAQIDSLFAEIGRVWGGLDILVHSIAFCPAADLHGRVVDCSREGFALAMDVSVHSFLRLVARAEPLMTEGGACLTVSFSGSNRVVTHYGVMGPVKAALESATRYMAAELGGKGIRVHALSPGPMPTRAAGGLAEFDALLARAEATAPTGRLASLGDVGAFAAFLASDAAANVTGGVYEIDGGFGLMG